MSKEEFTKLFRYIEEFRKEVSSHFTDVDKHFNTVDTRFDQQTKLITDYHQEVLALSHKVDRMEKWIHTIADKTGVKLEY